MDAERARLRNAGRSARVFSYGFSLRVEPAHKKLYEKLLSQGGTREQLQNAMLHYFRAPPVYTSKESLSVLTVNLGNFVRGRKKTVPAKYAQLVDRKDDSGVGPLVKASLEAKATLCVCLSSNLDIEEAAYLVRHGWYMQRHKGKDITIVTRTNMVGEYVEHLAGPAAHPSVHRHLPLSYWVVEIRYGRAPTQAIIRNTESNLQGRFSRNYMEDDLERCGMRVFRICAFHMSAKIASKKPALMLLADCFHYQVDYISGDANMAGYRTGGSKQGSTSIRDSCFQRWSGTISRPIMRRRVEIPIAVFSLEERGRD